MKAQLLFVIAAFAGAASLPALAQNDAPKFARQAAEITAILANAEVKAQLEDQVGLTSIKVNDDGYTVHFLSPSPIRGGMQCWIDVDVVYPNGGGQFDLHVGYATCLK